MTVRLDKFGQLYTYIVVPIDYVVHLGTYLKKN